MDMKIRTAVLCAAACAASLALAPCSAHAEVVWTFGNEDGVFDSGVNTKGVEDRTDASLVGVVGSTTGLLTDAATGASTRLQTVDIIGGDGTSAASGRGSSDFHETNISTKGFFGINTDQDQDDDLKADAAHFNPGEAWVFRFESDVELTQIVLVGFAPGEQKVRLQSTAFGDIALGAEGENDLRGAFVPAGTKVTLVFDSTSGDDTFKVGGLSFNVALEPG